MDNGRLEAAKDPIFKQVYQCVRCASCLNVCPIWTKVGGHVYGHIYSGGIGAVLTGLLNNGLDDFVHKVKEHHYVLSDVINSTGYGMFTVGIEQIAEELKAGD